MATTLTSTIAMEMENIDRRKSEDAEAEEANGSVSLWSGPSETTEVRFSDSWEQGKGTLRTASIFLIPLPTRRPSMKMATAMATRGRKSLLRRLRSSSDAFNSQPSAGPWPWPDGMTGLRDRCCLEFKKSMASTLLLYLSFSSLTALYVAFARVHLCWR